MTDVATIRANVGRIFRDMMEGRRAIPASVQVLYQQSETEANGSARVRTGSPLPPEQSRAETLRLTELRLQQLAVEYDAGRVTANTPNGPANPLLSNAVNFGINALPFGSYINTAANTFGIGNIFSGIGKVLSVAWEWLTQRPDTNGQTRGWGDIWQVHTQTNNLNNFAQALGITDPNFVAELTRPVQANPQVTPTGVAGLVGGIPMGGMQAITLFTATTVIPPLPTGTTAGNGTGTPGGH